MDSALLNSNDSPTTTGSRESPLCNPLDLGEDDGCSVYWDHDDGTLEQLRRNRWVLKPALASDSPKAKSLLNKRRSPRTTPKKKIPSSLASKRKTAVAGISSPTKFPSGSVPDNPDHTVNTSDLKPRGPSTHQDRPLRSTKRRKDRRHHLVAESQAGYRVCSLNQSSKSTAITPIIAKNSAAFSALASRIDSRARSPCQFNSENPASLAGKGKEKQDGNSGAENSSVCKEDPILNARRTPPVLPAQCVRSVSSAFHAENPQPAIVSIRSASSEIITTATAPTGLIAIKKSDNSGREPWDDPFDEDEEFSDQLWQLAEITDGSPFVNRVARTSPAPAYTSSKPDNFKVATSGPIVMTQPRSKLSPCQNIKCIESEWNRSTSSNGSKQNQPSLKGIYTTTKVGLSLGNHPQAQHAGTTIRQVESPGQARSAAENSKQVAPLERGRHVDRKTTKTSDRLPQANRHQAAQVVHGMPWPGNSGKESQAVSGPRGSIGARAVGGREAGFTMNQCCDDNNNYNRSQIATLEGGDASFQEEVELLLSGLADDDLNWDLND